MDDFANPEYNPPARVNIAQKYLRKRGVNIFRCPVCGNEFRYDDEYEPACTGPGATDEHPLTVMKFVRVDRNNSGNKSLIFP